MDPEVEEIIIRIGNDLHKGISRNQIVEQLIEEELNPQTAQNLLVLAEQWRAGQGHLGYTEWFWEIMKNRTPSALGTRWVWLATFCSVAATFPISIAIYSALPSGRYPLFLIILPTLLLGFLLAYIVAFPIFRVVTGRKTE